MHSVDQHGIVVYTCIMVYKQFVVVQLDRTRITLSVEYRDDDGVRGAFVVSMAVTGG